VRIAKLARFHGSAWCISPRVEIQHHNFAAKVFERKLFSVLVLQSKVRSFIIDIHRSFSVKMMSDGKIRSRFLYRKAALAVIFAALWATAFSAACQAQASQEDQAPEIIPAKKPRKKGQDPRAIALLQTNANGKTTLIPVAILIDGKFYDASAFKATPVPMVLETGTVYEAMRSGNSVGLFTVNGALHSKDSAAQNPWLGTGTYLPTGTVAPKSTRKAENVPQGMDDKDAPPRLSRSGAEPAKDKEKDQGKPTIPPASSAPQSSGPANGAKANPETAPTQTTGQPAGPKAEEKSQESQHPMLRRGRPTQPLPEDDEKSANSSTGDGTPTAKGNSAAKNTIAKDAAELLPAISDVGSPDPQSYVYTWAKGQEEQRRKQIEALAVEQVRAYIDRQAKGQIGGANESKRTPGTARKTTTKQAQPVLENVKFRAFDLWGSNDPVFVLSAEAHPPSASKNSPGGWKTESANQPANAVAAFTITLVVKTDIYGNLRKLYSGITDKYHLDVTPALELVDAVDADGDGRGELLFRETSDAGIGYVLYRATADTLWKMFDSLNQD
jgi:hypothetical protein